MKTTLHRFLFLPLLLALLPVLARAELVPAIDGLGEAINQAGRQRMLTQRIVKAYGQILLEVQPDEARGQLDGAITLFEAQLANLRRFAPNASVRQGLDQVAGLWAPFRAQATAEVTPQGLDHLLLLNEGLLGAAHRVVLQLEEISGTPLGRLVNIAGRQRMLSQRIAKFYMARAAGFESEETRSELERASDEFRAALEELLAAPENSAEISTALAEVKRQWTVFEASFRMQDGHYAPKLIAVYSEKVLERMNTITGLYARLATT